MKNSWVNKIIRAQNEVTDKHQKDAENQLAQYYTVAADKAIQELEAVYSKTLLAVSEGEKPIPADLYKSDRYWQAQGALKRELQALGDKQISLLTKQLKGEFFDIYNSFSLEGEEPVSTLNKADMEQMIQASWVADGKTYPQRVWDNISRLQETLNEELVHYATSGRQSVELRDILQERFNISYRRADTLVRTELAHIQTEAAKKSYEDYGIQYVAVEVILDERTCEECAALDGEIFPIHAAPMLPLHPNERCYLIPVYDI